jgi:DNA invertase Pin-like site-specific DNA recombinase
MRAAIYARFSTEKQSEASIEDQFRVCERIAEREGLDVVYRYSDAAISGGTAQRPGYRAMLSAARRGEFEVIVAEDSSRIWRELAEQWRALKELQDLGVHVVGHGLDTRREESKILLAVNGAMAEGYRDEIARRTRRGLEGRAVAGHSTGGKAYGYVSARDAATGRIEVNEAEAAVVRRIFEAYAAGMSPRAIAAMLNADGVPSPGASWNRTVRRASGWLASAIHGDVTRGSGILNNRRYIGVVAWGRAQWKRGAADSSKRRMRMNPKPLHEALDERLRIVPQDLWERVKTRQESTRLGVGKLIRRGQRKRAPGAGRPGKYLFSGLLSCGVCNASFVLRNREHYACASWWNGAACSNGINVPRGLVQDVMLAGLREDLSDPQAIDEFERRVKAALRQSELPVPDHSRRIAQLEKEIGNLTDAIAGGLLRRSPALADRLRAAEAELESLNTLRTVRRSAPRVPDIRDGFLKMVAGLDEVLTQDPERGREHLRGILGSERIKMKPDGSGRFLWADYSLGLTALVPSELRAEIMVAGAVTKNAEIRMISLVFPGTHHGTPFILEDSRARTHHGATGHAIAFGASTSRTSWTNVPGRAVGVTTWSDRASRQERAHVVPRDAPAVAAAERSAASGSENCSACRGYRRSRSGRRRRDVPRSRPWESPRA